MVKLFKIITTLVQDKNAENRTIIIEGFKLLIINMCDITNNHLQTTSNEIVTETLLCNSLGKCFFLNKLWKLSRYKLTIFSCNTL